MRRQASFIGTRTRRIVDQRARMMWYGLAVPERHGGLPCTFALSGYPTEWLQALERIDRLDATTIVTGHGAPLHDKTLLRATMNVFRVLLREGKSAKARGLDPDQAQAAILPGLHHLMIEITHDDPA